MGSILYLSIFVFDGMPGNGKHILFKYLVFDEMPGNGKFTLFKYLCL